MKIESIFFEEIYEFSLSNLLKIINSLMNHLKFDSLKKHLFVKLKNFITLFLQNTAKSTNNNVISPEKC